MKTLKYIADLVGVASSLSMIVVVGLVLQHPLQQFVVLGIFMLVVLSTCVAISQTIDRKMTQQKSHVKQESTNEHVG